MPQASFGIAGGGLLGRLLAWSLSSCGHDVEVFDPAPSAGPSFDGHQAAGFTAAGMLSPLAELDNSSLEIARLGWRSIELWRTIDAAIDSETTPGWRLRQLGSLLLAHRSDLGAASRVLARLDRAGAEMPSPKRLDESHLRRLEPSLHGAAHAWLLPDEGQVDTVAMMHALQRHAARTRWHWGEAVSSVEPGRLRMADGSLRAFGHVFDVRGVGAREALRVRGVRGELVWLDAPAHGLSRPVRLLHPRHRIYVVPRSPDRLLVGASEIESEDRSAMSLRSAVELMAAAHSILPGIDEARIARLDVNLRPALPDNEPLVESQLGLTRINGLFRHGWLLAPALVEKALRSIDPALLGGLSARVERQAA